MMLFLRRLASIVGAFFFFWVLSQGQAAAQVISQPPADLAKDPFLLRLPAHIAGDPYILELIRILKEWNSFEVKIPEKSQLKPVFESRLKEIVTRKKYPYQDGSWAEEMRRKFDKLTESLKPERKIDVPAGLLLILLFTKELDRYKKQVVREKVREELSLPIYMILGKAQEDAAAVRSPSISSDLIIGSLFAWWTTIWPFCD